MPTTPPTPNEADPLKRTMPEPIPDTPENIARALVTSPSKKPDEWRYLQDGTE